MKSKIQNIRGTQDFFGEKIDKFNYIINTVKNIVKKYNFKEISTPIIENSDLFERNLGDSSDVVLKELYKFQDKSGDMISLRPEFTAGVVRSFLDNGELNQNLPQKLFSYGSIFRYDRPQKGRYRQFNQINCEYFGYSSYLEDLEILVLANEILTKFNLKNISLEINSLGSVECKKKYENLIKEYFNKYKKDLSEDSKIRLEKNPLRILDSKDENDKKLLKDMPLINNSWSKSEKEYFDKILENLTNLNIKYIYNPFLVRGLDYYTSTVFEFTTTDLGAQATVLGGGRYDNLVEQIGDTKIPSVGFGGGIERMILLIDNQKQQEDLIAIVPITENENTYSIKLANELRNKNYNIEIMYNGKFKNKMEKINKINATHLIVIGEDETKTNNLKIKNLSTGKEEKFII